MTTTAPAAPRTHPVLDRAAAAVLAWAALYGALRAYWAAGNAPEFAPLDHDLLLFTGWAPVGLCAAAAAAAAGLHLTRDSRAALAAAWAVVAAMVAASPLFFLDVIGGVLAGLGIAINPASALGRGGMVAGAALLAVAAVAYRRRMRDACARCGRRENAERPDRVPTWAWVGAYAAVVACVVRLAAQFGFGGLDGIPFNRGVSAVAFEVGFILAGTLLPPALVHRWGLIWPRWVLPLAGRRVPRWLVLGPALFVSGGMIAYFGFQQVHLFATLFTGEAVDVEGTPYTAAFFWIAIPSYTVWGLGMGAAALARLRQTRPTCKTCGL